MIEALHNQFFLINCIESSLLINLLKKNHWLPNLLGVQKTKLLKVYMNFQDASGKLTIKNQAQQVIGYLHMGQSQFRETYILLYTCQ